MKSLGIESYFTIKIQETPKAFGGNGISRNFGNTTTCLGYYFCTLLCVGIIIMQYFSF